jgi:hypothetical protein
MNQLQSLSEDRHGPVLVTLNPPFAVDEAKEVGRYKYEHPVYSKAVRPRSPYYSQRLIIDLIQSVKAQSRLPEIQNARRVTFAGAWTNYGFHEDGFTSGLKIATEIFGATPPFPVRPASRDIQREPVARAVVWRAEAVRRWIEGSRAWDLVVRFVVLFWVLVERLVKGLGMDELAGEVKSVRGFWVDEKKDQ